MAESFQVLSHAFPLSRIVERLLFTEVEKYPTVAGESESEGMWSSLGW